MFLWIVLGSILSLLFIVPLRKRFITSNLMKIIELLKLLPVISETEKTALEAGSIWVDGELFKGNPDHQKLMKEPLLQLTQKEKHFINTECEELCRLCNDEKAYLDQNLSDEVWGFLKREKFFGLCIPQEYGGLGFSASAHSEIIHKLSTRSIPLAITTMVPNSLGPAELLMHYGTQQQKNYYLPRLARGEEIPCFGLTEPNAGSDAGSIQAFGVLFKGDDGQLYLKMSWKKRYITLGAVSSLLGIAIKVSDPQLLLGRGKDLGITCVLVPSETQGVRLGLRHDPLGVPFYNSPIEGEDVLVSVDQVIGGVSGIGNGWRMLMECLAAGRSISLPSYSAGAAKKILRATSSYVKVRQQFGVPLWRFEGVDEVLAEMTAFTYILDASRMYTVASVDRGIKPAVVSAITKYQSTEIQRKIASKAMDLWGGAGISLGSNNIIARYYTSAPISITVEGANILTRSMIIFGQGAIRCHPYAYKEIKALQEKNISEFDSAFFGHSLHIIKNVLRLTLHSFTRATFAPAPNSKMSSYFKKLTWASTSFVVMSEIAMIVYGGKLKFKEKLTGRFADILSWMYLVTATLRRYESSKTLEEEDVVHFALKYGFYEIEQAFQGLYKNIDVPVLGWIFRKIVLPWSRLNPFDLYPSDQLGSSVTKKLVMNPKFRDLLTLNGVFLPNQKEDRMCQLEDAYNISSEVEILSKRIEKSIREGALSKGRVPHKIKEALEKGVIQSHEAKLFEAYQLTYEQIIAVNAYKV